MPHTSSDAGLHANLGLMRNLWPICRCKGLQAFSAGGYGFGMLLGPLWYKLGAPFASNDFKVVCCPAWSGLLLLRSL